MGTGARHTHGKNKTWPHLQLHWRTGNKSSAKFFKLISGIAEWEGGAVPSLTEQYTYLEIRKNWLFQKEGIQACKCGDGEREELKVKGVYTEVCRLLILVKVVWWERK